MTERRGRKQNRKKKSGMREREGESSESSSGVPDGSFWSLCHWQSVPGVDRAHTDLWK